MAIPAKDFTNCSFILKEFGKVARVNSAPNPDINNIMRQIGLFAKFFVNNRHPFIKVIRSLHEFKSLGGDRGDLTSDKILVVTVL